MDGSGARIGETRRRVSEPSRARGDTRADQLETPQLAAAVSAGSIDRVDHLAAHSSRAMPSIGLPSTPPSCGRGTRIVSTGALTIDFG